VYITVVASNGALIIVQEERNINENILSDNTLGDYSALSASSLDGL
jgi:hypothetical protein